MRSHLFSLSVLLLCLSGPIAAAQDPVLAQATLHGEASRRQALRQAVEAHRASQLAEQQRESEAVGRRLTPAELAKLREQLRREWAAFALTGHPAESAAGERLAPTPVADALPPAQGATHATPP